MTTRRGFFGFIAGALAATKLPLPRLTPVPLAEMASQAEFNAIVRKAFVPRVVVQVYNSQPMLSMMMANAKAARDGPR